MSNENEAEVEVPFSIAPCTDKAWRESCPHQIDASGWDGGGNMHIEIPLTDDELDAVIALLQKYREQHPRAFGANTRGGARMKNDELIRGILDALNELGIETDDDDNEVIGLCGQGRAATKLAAIIARVVQDQDEK